LGSTEALAASPAPAPTFRAIFEANFASIWALLRRLGVAERDREDVANEVFFRVHERMDTYDPRRPIRPWLFAFAVRAASDYRRLARHKREVYDDLEALAPGLSPDELALEREKQRIVLAALDKLDLDRRAVFVLHELDGCSVPEIAEALDIPEGTAYSRLRAAREQFAAAVRRLRTTERGP
jgi:RNA polymerase sigma-70 factor (ECF subfamily)